MNYEQLCSTVSRNNCAKVKYGRRIKYIVEDINIILIHWNYLEK